MFLIALALAHSPHDTATFVALAPDGTALTAHNDLLAQTTDGHTFTFAHLGGHWLECGWALSGRRALGVAGGQLYVVEDGAVSALSPSEIKGCDRRELAFSAQGSIWQSDDGLRWTSAATPGWDPIQLATWGDGWFGLDEQGLVFWINGTTATPVRDEPMRTLASDGQTVVLAPIGGWLLVSHDGQQWDAVVSGPTDVYALAIDGPTWLAATATEAVWVSRDSGQTWTKESENLEVPSSGLGSPQDGAHYSGLAIGADRWALSSWEGFFWSDATAQPARWHQGALHTVPLVRDVQWWGSELIIGVYGAGLYQGTPGGDDWRDITHSVTWSYPRRFLATENAYFLLVGVQALRSTDAGQTWSGTNAPTNEPGEGLAMGEDGRLYLAGYSDGTGQMLVSTDLGETWAVVTLTDCARRPEDVAAVGTVAWVACQNRLYQSTDGGVTWPLIDTLDAEITSILPGLTPADPPILATVDGLWSDGQSVALSGVATYVIRRAPDGAWWVSTGQGLVVLDPSPRWLGWPTLDLVQDIDVRADGVVAVGTHDGAWWSEDQGATWSRATDWDIYDAPEGSYWWSGWETRDDDGAKAGEVEHGRPGAHLELDVEGSFFTLYAANPDPAVVQIGIDGDQAVVRWDAGELGPRWQGAAMAGPHTLTLDVLEGVIEVDRVERWREREGPLAVGTGDCGGSGAGLGLVLLWGRRRRKM